MECVDGGLNQYSRFKSSVSAVVRGPLLVLLDIMTFILKSMGTYIKHVLSIVFILMGSTVNKSSQCISLTLLL